jgi:hypothetical protein
MSPKPRQKPKPKVGKDVVKSDKSVNKDGMVLRGRTISKTPFESNPNIREKEQQEGKKPGNSEKGEDNDQLTVLYKLQ